MTKGGRTRYRELCRGCSFLTVEEGVPDLRISPMLDTHAHDGRWNLPGRDLLYSVPPVPALGFRCRVDGKRVRQGDTCRFFTGDPRLDTAPA